MISLVPLEGIPEIRPGDDLAEMIAAALAAAGIGLTDDDVLVVTQKVVSKAEGRVVDLSTVEPRAEAREWAERWGKDPRQVELVLRESAEVVRMADGGLIISRTRHGFVCANAGVDLSNTGGEELATLLPVDPDGVGACAAGAAWRAGRRAAGGRHLRLVRPAVAQRDRERRDRGGGDRRRSTTCVARRTRTAATCARPSSPWPMSLPPPPTWRAARWGNDRWCSSAEQRSRDPTIPVPRHWSCPGSRTSFLRPAGCCAPAQRRSA